MSERMRSYYQYGLESTRGTAVAATRVLGAEIKPIPTDRRWEKIKYPDGRRTDGNAKRSDSLLVADSLMFSNAYFQLWPMLYLCSLDGTISPSEQTPSQSDYLWTALPLLNAANDPDSITLEMGDNTQAVEIEYVQFNRIKLSFAVPQDGGQSPVAVEVGYYGRQVSTASFTSSLSLPTGLAPMNGKLARLYLDTSWAGLGGTEQTSLLRGAEVEILIGNHPKQFGSANQYFATHGEGIISSKITLMLERGATSDGYWDLFRAGTERALRLEINGPQIGSGTNHRWRLDQYGYFELVEPLNAEDRGNNIDMAVFQSLADSSANFLQSTVVTNLATA